jgi:excisionase family DNA binding protein
MTRIRPLAEPVVASLHRRGGVRGTGAASGSPLSELAQSRSFHAGYSGATLELPLLLDSRQVARLLGISRTKAFEMMARCQLPVVRIGRCVRVSRVALSTWVEECIEREPSSPAARNGGLLS